MLMLEITIIYGTIQCTVCTQHKVTDLSHIKGESNFMSVIHKSKNEIFSRKKLENYFLNLLSTTKCNFLKKLSFHIFNICK